VKLLLNDIRVDINKAANDGWTPFHIACYNGHTEIVKLLLNDKRIDINNPRRKCKPDSAESSWIQHDFS